MDNSCSIVTSSFSDPECETERHQPTSDSNLPAIVGGAVAGVVALTVSIYNDLCCHNKKMNKNIPKLVISCVLCVLMAVKLDLPIPYDFKSYITNKLRHTAITSPSTCHIS